MKVSRLKVIQKLVRKKYKSKRPTADQILQVIKEHDLQLHKSDGTKRNREVIGKAIAKALNRLK